MADIAGSNGDRKTFKIVGKRNIPGRLSYSIATGKAKFGVDVVVPDMLFAKFLRNPYGRARVKSLNIGKAKRLPGVVDIVTWEDPDINAIPQIDLPLLINEADMEDDEVGVIVVAESEEICDEALKLIEVDWEVLPHILDPREGRKPDAPILRANPNGRGKVLRPTSLESQIHQVMMFSDGAGLMEEFIFDKATGVKLHTNMFEYKKPTILDIGPVDIRLVETRSGNACYGASGISHSMATTQLIACAAANAIDRWIAPPLTPDKVLKALGKA